MRMKCATAVILASILSLQPVSLVLGDEFSEGETGGWETLDALAEPDGLSDEAFEEEYILEAEEDHTGEGNIYENDTAEEESWETEEDSFLSDEPTPDIGLEEELKDENSGFSAMDDPAVEMELEEALQLVRERLKETWREKRSQLRREGGQGNYKGHPFVGVNVGASEVLGGSICQNAVGDEVLVGAGELPPEYCLNTLLSDDGEKREHVRKAPYQGDNNCCWAYTMTAAAETAASFVPDRDIAEVDDSEAYLAYFAHSLLNGEGSLQYRLNEDGSLTSYLENPFVCFGTTAEAGQLLTGSLGPVREDALPPIPNSIEEMNKAVSSSGFTSLQWNDPSLLSDHMVTDVNFLPEPNGSIGKGGYTFDENAIEAIKYSIADGCPVAVGIYMPVYDEKSELFPYADTWENALYVSEEGVRINHEVVIVGWDDTYSKNNFRDMPEGDGAWICRNSYGNYEDDYRSSYEADLEESFEQFKKEVRDMGYDVEEITLMDFAEALELPVSELGLSVDTIEDLAWLVFELNEMYDEDGLFYLSYYDRAYNGPTSLEVETRDAFSGEELLMYDYLGMSNHTDMSNSREQSGCTANVFRTGENKKSLKRVAVFTAECGSSVDVKVYLLSEGAKNPDDGTLLFEKNGMECAWAGYHILGLGEEVVIPAQSSFSVVVTITGPYGDPYTPLEYGGTDAGSPEYRYVAEENEPGTSFILTGSGWTDLKDYSLSSSYIRDAKPGNAMIRVFLAQAEEGPDPTSVPTPTLTPTPTSTLTPTSAPTLTPTPTATPTSTPTLTPTFAPTSMPTVTLTPTRIPTPTRTPVPTSAPTLTPTPTSTPTQTPTPAPKQANTLSVKAKTPSVKASKVKKKAQTIKAGKAFSVSDAQGAVSYKKIGGAKKLTLSSNGKITVAKGTKKGTYKIKVEVTAAGNDRYESKTVNVTVKVKVA